MNELLGREAELEAIGERVAAAADGEGAVLGVEGEAGIGKTALLGAALRIGRERGMRALLATGMPFEAAFPFGIARQLLDPVRRELGEERWAELSAGAAGLASRALDERALEAADPDDDPSFATLHGLYWLTANLSLGGPLVLAVDDVHWADPPSLRFLAHLARRLDDVPAVIVCAVRSGDPPTDRLLVSELLTTSAPTLRPDPLGEGDAAELVRARLGGTAEDDLCAACHRATGGNPFLLRALGDALASGEVSPSAEAIDSLRGVRLETVARSLLHRLALMPEGSDSLVAAAATLGGEAPLARVAELAGVGAAEAARAAEALREAGILAAGHPVAFAHPVVRAAVYEGMPSGERRAMHLRAARLLAEGGAPADQLAPHYLAIGGSGDPEVVVTLRQAARQASARGAPDVAASYLRRALAEPPAEADRPRVRFELGRAGVAAEEGGSAEHLRDAVSAIPDPGERADAALEAAVLLGFNANTMDVISVCRAALSDRGAIDPELAAKLEAEMALCGLLNPPTVAESVGWVEARREHPDPLTLPAATLGAAWVRLAHEARPAAAEIERLVGMVEDGSLFASPSAVVAQGAVWVLSIAGRPDLARDVGEAVVAMGEQQGSILIASVGRFWRAVAELELGLIADAAADSAAACEIALEGAGDDEGVCYILSTLIDSLIEAGDLERAAATLARAEAPRASEENGEATATAPVTLPTDLPSRAGSAILIESRGRLRTTQGRLADAVADLLDAGRRWEELGVVGPVASLWRGDAALALSRLGETDEARRLASEQLELARRSAEPRTLGASLRALGELEVGDPGQALLAEAVEVLEATPARLELAKALLALGAALRKAGKRRAARDPLARALEIADHGGADRVAEGAREELRLAGARPRRAALTGAESLTPAERRVAELAAAGTANREIAQRLFVSLRTVETHLTHVYRKLEISARDDLAAALDGGS